MNSLNKEYERNETNNNKKLIQKRLKHFALKDLIFRLFHEYFISFIQPDTYIQFEPQTYTHTQQQKKIISLKLLD